MCTFSKRTLKYEQDSWPDARERRTDRQPQVPTPTAPPSNCENKGPKLSGHRRDLGNILDPLDLNATSRTHTCPQRTRTVTNVDHMLGHKPTVNTFPRAGNPRGLFSEHEGIKLKSLSNKLPGKAPMFGNQYHPEWLPHSHPTLRVTMSHINGP